MIRQYFLRGGLPLCKEIEITGYFEVLPHVTTDELIDTFLEFIESNSWYFGGGCNNDAYDSKIAHKKIGFGGCVEVSPELTKDAFVDAFLTFVGSKGWQFDGNFQEIMDGYYVNPGGTKGKHVMDD
jgi:uncharacterized protein YggL (DUF469 family)